MLPARSIKHRPTLSFVYVSLVVKREKRKKRNGRWNYYSESLLPLTVRVLETITVSPGEDNRGKST